MQIFLSSAYEGSPLETRPFLWFYLLITTLTVVGFFFMVSSLWAFHTYLISKNLTTWEFLSWMKITYMKVWPKKYGSPFDRGSKAENLRFFFNYDFSKSPFLYPWSMPKRLPKLRV